MRDSRGFWDKQAKNFSATSDDEAYMMLEKIKDYLNKEDRVLDFACGTGGSSRALASRVSKVLGIDYSKEMIHFASENISNPDNVVFNVCSLDDVSLDDEQFDVITAFNVLHLIDDLGPIVDRVHHLLKEDGVFISLSACHDEKKNFASFAIKALSKMKVLPSVNAFSVNKLVQDIITSGFVKLHVEVLKGPIANVLIIVKKSDSGAL